METIQKMELLKLSDIAIGKTNPRSEFDERGIQELAHSIKEKGVLQPIVVRTNGKAGKYELVCGERRYRASKSINAETIPAMIRTMDDDEAFDLQITENLQRKDVHPMDEALAFKTLVDKKKQTINEIALRFGKSESYITGRIKLNDLIPELKKDFYADKFGIGHAILLCRLTAEEQKESMDDFMEGYGKDRDYVTVNSLKQFIEQDIMNNLSSVPFKKDDANLIPKAGPCTTCPKRSGTNPSLFPDIKEKDRCFDRSCFDKKVEAHIVITAKDIIETRPEVFLLQDYSGQIPEAITKLAQGMKVRILKNYTDFHESQGKADKGNAVKGFYINGREAGKFVSVKLTKVSESKGSVAAAKNKVENGEASPEDVKAVIAGIREREKRAKELDYEKVSGSIAIELQKSNSQKAITTPLTDDEWKALWWFVEQKTGYGIDKVSKLLKMSGHFKDFKGLKPDEYALLVRVALFSEFRPEVSEKSDGSHIMRALAQSAKIDIKMIEKEQQDIANKRMARVEERIKALQGQMKQPKEKAEKKESKTPSSMKSPAFMQKMILSESLAVICGAKPMVRTEVVKKVWEYIKKNKLQDTKEKRYINPDDALKKIFDGKTRVDMFSMTKMISNHMTSPSKS